MIVKKRHRQCDEFLKLKKGISMSICFDAKENAFVRSFFFYFLFWQRTERHIRFWLKSKMWYIKYDFVSVIFFFFCSFVPHLSYEKVTRWLVTIRQGIDRNRMNETKHKKKWKWKKKEFERIWELARARRIKTTTANTHEKKRENFVCWHWQSSEESMPKGSKRRE